MAWVRDEKGWRQSKPNPPHAYSLIQAMAFMARGGQMQQGGLLYRLKGDRMWVTRVGVEWMPVPNGWFSDPNFHEGWFKPKARVRSLK